MAYGYTDAQILDSIEEFGAEWALDAYEMIMEDYDRDWQIFLTMMPFARTPMDKKSGKGLARAMSRFRKDLSRMLVPWVEMKRIQEIKKRMSKPPESAAYNEDGSKINFSDPHWWREK